jgi:hypothetical protein
MQDSSTHIRFKDGTSSAASQPVLETTAPSGNLAAIMANWVVVPPRPEITQSGPKADPPPTR